LDCNIYTLEKGKSRQIIKANDWIKLTPEKFYKMLLGKEAVKRLKLKYASDYDILIKNLTVIKENDVVVGRAALYALNEIKDFRRIYGHGSVTIGGTRSSGLRDFIGMFIGEPTTASRNSGIPVISYHKLSEWISSQLEKLKNEIISEEKQLEIAYTCRTIAINTAYLKIAQHSNGFMDYQDIKKYVYENNDEQYYLVQDAAIHLHNRYNSFNLICHNNVFWMDCGIHSLFIDIRGIMPDWPFEKQYSERCFDNYTLKGAVIEAIAEGWGCSVNDIYRSSKFSKDGKSYTEIIGIANGEDVLMKHVDIIIRPKSKKIK
jgi:hypothetical protein